MADEKLRLFIAVSVPKSQRSAVANATTSLRGNLLGARWIEPDNQHITLKFLGWVPEEKKTEVSAVCKSVAAGHPRTEISLTDLGAFPNAKRPRVLWIGVDDPTHVLEGLARGLDESLEPLGFSREERPFTPHLTLARFKMPVKSSGHLPQFGLRLAPFVIDRVGLFRSILSPKGARYEVIQEFPLA